MIVTIRIAPPSNLHRTMQILFGIAAAASGLPRYTPARIQSSQIVQA
jgi:hypothetical protein